MAKVSTLNEKITVLLTKLFKDIVKARVERDPAFRVALFQEALSAFFEGDTMLGKSLLRDLVNSTINFEGLARDYHHRHYMGKVAPVEFASYEATLDRSQKEWQETIDRLKKGKNDKSNYSYR